jgi:hypothetical protein
MFVDGTVNLLLNDASVSKLFRQKEYCRAAFSKGVVYSTDEWVASGKVIAVKPSFEAYKS